MSVCKCGLAILIISTCITVSTIGQTPATQPVGADAVELAGQLWKIMRSADSDSPDLKAARKELLGLIAKAPPAQKTLIATRLMDPSAGESMNATALELLGRDPIPLEDVRSMLFNQDRSYRRRLLLRTYYSFCRSDRKSSVLSPQMMLKLADLLAGRVEKLAGKKPPYGEQRLLVRLCASILSPFAYAARDEREVRRFFGAMRVYAKTAERGEAFGETARGWLTLHARREGLVANAESALLALGHWNPLIRWKASAFLGKLSTSDPDAIQQTWALLDDPRDEVRAAAARVFVFAGQANPEKVVPRMVRIITEDRGVIVQAAAAEVLAAYAHGTDVAIQPLLDAFKNRRRPGAKRTGSILLALSHLAVRATDEQKKRILDLAVKSLRRSTKGALAALKALGPYAQRAVGAIVKYRDAADRFQRRYINQHVLPAIMQRPTRE